MRWQVIAAWVLGVSVAVFDLANADPVRQDDAFDRIKAVAPPLPAQRLNAQDFQVKEWVLGPQRQRDLKPVPAKALFLVGDTFYAEEDGTGRWLVGRRSDAGKPVIECDSQFASLHAMLDAHAFAPLPKPPNGFTLREVARLPDFPTRLASDGQGKKLYILCTHGDVWRLNLSTGSLRQILWGNHYHRGSRGYRLLMGMVLDDHNRLYLSANYCDRTKTPITNEVTIFRTTTHKDGDQVDPKAWLRTSYPYGIGPFNHGVGHMSFGPDGFLYLNSGSRTDGNEPGRDPRYSTEGETPLTACIWRLDPRLEEPAIEVYTRGLRNAYGFCWNNRGEMYATDNGPDADPPEELNRIEQGKHYGFPYRFSDWTTKPYSYTPDPPPGLTFTLPIANVGPDAGGTRDKPMYTFDPHSSPSGIVFLGDDFPPPYRGGYFVARFGNLLERPRVGFDLLHVALTRDNRGIDSARVHQVLFPIARPVDLHLSGKGKVYICEYSRQIDNKGFNGMLPGRILELAVNGR
jgi:glucose/arabinose dehydrogenase